MLTSLFVLLLGVVWGVFCPSEGSVVGSVSVGSVVGSLGAPTSAGCRSVAVEDEWSECVSVSSLGTNRGGRGKFGRWVPVAVSSVGEVLLVGRLASLVVVW